MLAEKSDAVMKLDRLLEGLPAKEILDPRDVDVSVIATDSRRVREGCLFVALRGASADGHDFIGEAEARGAVACVTEVPAKCRMATNVVVEDTSKALALLAARFYGNPADALFLCGVTGTNGKTSTVYFLRSVLETSGWGRTGVIGTVGHGVGDSFEEALHTTPDSLKLHELLYRMKEQGCRGVVMEVSSHAVRQRRVWGLDFSVGILTNVTRDHLDYHKTMEDYISAKREFCMSLASPARKREPGILVYNFDDPVSRGIGEAFPGERVSVGTDREASVLATELEADLAGTRFTLHLGPEEKVPVRLGLLGNFNAYNAALAAAAARRIGVSAEEVKRGLEALKNVPGRFQSLGGGERPLVVVDYSHTPDSLESVLNFCRELGPSRLITVFGCGGDRDRGKRPIMGEIAQRLSDKCYVTSDNPRTENPGDIIEEILAGMDRASDNLVVDQDRRSAIRTAILEASAGEVVAICGKGHENYQIIGNRKIPFDDREEASRALELWRSKRTS